MSTTVFTKNQAGGVNTDKANNSCSINDNQRDIRNSRVRVLAVSGASGGHIFPALAFLDTLKDRHGNVEALLVLPRGNIISQVQNLDYNVRYVSISPVKLNLEPKNFISLWRLLKGSLESMFILIKFRPDIVVGFGSLVCVPMIMSAWLLRIKTLVHEQNVMPGRANRFLARFADRIAVSFIETRDYFKHLRRKITVTGNPIRKELKLIDKEEALSFFGLSNDKLTILVMGGSLGSHRLNLGFLKAVSAISGRHNFQVIHLTGTGDYDLLKDSYKGLNVTFRLITFLKDMHYAYSACDLVISRAGATTLAEIIFFGLPAIIVPYPYAYGHQMNNARVLERTGSGIIIQDNQLGSGMLRESMESLIDDPQRLVRMRSCYRNILRPNANDLLIDEVMSLIVA